MGLRSKFIELQMALGVVAIKTDVGYHKGANVDLGMCRCLGFKRIMYI